MANKLLLKFKNLHCFDKQTRLGFLQVAKVCKGPDRNCGFLVGISNGKEKLLTRELN